MAYSPKPAGPRSIRELFHYLWRELTEIGIEIGEGGGGSSDHDDLTNVTSDQHHPQLHDLDSHTDVTAPTPSDTEVLTWDSGQWINAPSAGGLTRPGVREISTATYTVTASDETFLLLFTNAAGCVVTGPVSTSENLPVGFICHLHQEAAGEVEFVVEAGAATRTAIGLKTRVQYSSMSIIVQATDIYKIIGDVTP